MNNEPVAWISENDLMNICHKHPYVSRDKILDDDIPLYTHPAKTEDEEINPAPTLEEIIKWQQERISELEYLNNEHRGVIKILMNDREALDTFIKERTWFDVDAILRKAQEK